MLRKSCRGGTLEEALSLLAQLTLPLSGEASLYRQMSHLSVSVAIIRAVSPRYPNLAVLVMSSHRL